MLRVLYFTGEKAQGKFDRIWEGILFGGRGEQSRRQASQQPADVEKNRKLAKLSSALKAISTESKRVITGQLFFRDVKEDARLELEQHLLVRLRELLESTEWLPEQMDDAFEVIDWIDAAEKVENT